LPFGPFYGYYLFTLGKRIFAFKLTHPTHAMPMNFVAKILKFNPTTLLNSRLRRRQLLSDPHVRDMIRIAHAWGANYQTALNLSMKDPDQYSVESLFKELEK
jgi:hypothetical protein